MDDLYQCTIEQYNTYHDWVIHPDRADIPEGGKVYKHKGVDAPEKLRSTHYCLPSPHPTNPNDYVLRYGQYPNPAMGLTEKTDAQAISEGYLKGDDPSNL